MKGITNVLIVTFVREMCEEDGFILQDSNMQRVTSYALLHT
jgi:hypothetical protein